ncbi:recombinase family protein [bacterium]|nr:recombinase family protein [bacterium]
MKTYAGYIRVSTAKQGEKGVSLQEQRAAIEAYSSRNRLALSQWFEERETAAKLGRPVFNQMIGLLRRGRLNGVVIHKIDRSARNLRDWADIGDLIDSGVEVHFAGDALDLQTRGGRLSADIQAVVAADFIRNLREETRKGMYGRLKQGLYPLAAPLGYLDRGKGMPKEIDPIRGQLVRHLFELYASGNHSLDTLVVQARHLGLTNRNGRPLLRTAISSILRNPFYMGLVMMGPNGETYQGVHQPLIAPRLFESVQRVLAGRIRHVAPAHAFLFRGLLTCGACGGILTGELHKGHVYYRCHNRLCTEKASAREEAVEEAVSDLLKRVQPSDTEMGIILKVIALLRGDWDKERLARRDQLRLQLSQTKARLDRLVDSHLEGLLETTVFCEKKVSLLSGIRQIEENLADLNDQSAGSPAKLEKCFELAKTALLTYETGNSEQKRELVEIVSSNRRVFRKNVVVEPSNPFQMLLERPTVRPRVPQRDAVRTLMDWFMSKEGMLFDIHLKGLGL